MHYLDITKGSWIIKCLKSQLSEHWTSEMSSYKLNLQFLSSVSSLIGFTAGCQCCHPFLAQQPQRQSSPGEL